MKGFLKLSISGMLFLFILLIFQPPMKAESASIDERTIVLPKDMFDGEVEPTAESGKIVNVTGTELSLKGLSGRKELLFDVPSQGIQKSSYLQLNVQYSELLLEGSTVSILIDDTPVHSTELDIDKKEMALKIPLNEESLKQGFHRLTISFYGHISEKLCTDMENPANWLTISPESYLFLNTMDIEKRENVLQDYPYPFIQDETIQSTIVIPDQASTPILTAALNMANSISGQAVNPVPILKESELDSISTHLIVLGAENQWKGKMKEILSSTKSLTVPKNELVVSNYFLQFPQVAKQMMVITAADDQTIAEKISIFTEKALIDQLAGNELSIDKVPTIPTQKVKERETFQDLGFANLTLNGSSNLSEHLFYQLPTYVDVYNNALLHLKIKVSDTLLQDETESDKQHMGLVVYINEVPHTIAIDDMTNINDGSFYEVDVPIEANLLREEAFLNIQFQADGLGSQDFCAPPNDAKWIFLHEDSYLQLPILETSAKDSFDKWPAPFVSIDGNSETAILIPDEYDQAFIEQLQLVTNELGSKSELNGFQLLFEQDAIDEKLKGRHVIVLGELKNHLSLKSYTDQLIVDINGEHQLDVSAFDFLNETSKHVAWLQPSVWDNNKTMAVFAAVQPNETSSFLSDRLINYLQTNTINTNIVVESYNGDIFTYDLDEKSDSNMESTFADQTEESKEIDSRLIIGFVAIVIISITIFIFILRKNKKNKGSKKRND